MVKGGGLIKRTDYTASAKGLHWLIAALIFVQFPLAWTMGEFSGLDKFRAYNIHKSIGLVILSVMALRLIWRLFNPPPSLPQSLPARERILAHTWHIALYVAILAMTLSGWAMISSSNKPSVFFNAAPFPLIPWLASLAPEEKKQYAKVFAEVHEITANVLLFLVAVHVAAALRHALVLKDGVMSRMLPRFLRGANGAKSAGLALAILSWCAISLAASGEAKAMEWSVNPKKSQVSFEATGSGYTAQGVFKTYKAEIEFDPDAPEQTSIYVSLDVASATTGTADVDQTLQSPDFFNPARYPTAEFVARGAKPDGKGKYILNGRLTLKGVTKPITLPFAIEIEAGVAAVKGETAIDRLEFGVGPETVAGMTVEKDVKLTLDLTAVRLDN